MTIEEILPQFKSLEGKFSREAVQEAITQKEAITPYMLDALAEAANNPQAVLDREDFTYTYAAFLLPQFREPRAFPLILKLASYDREMVDMLMTDSITEDLHQWLASTYNGDLGALQQLIENREADNFVRSAGIHALAMITAHGMLPRDVLMSYYKELLETRLEKEAMVERTGVAVQATDLGPTAEVYQLIKEGYEGGTIDDTVMPFSWVEAAMEKDPQKLLEKYCREHPLVEDTVKEMEWWAGFEDNKSHSLPISELLYSGDLAESHQPYIAPQKVGRNDPCPCGSGKKYKKCHGA